MPHYETAGANFRRIRNVFGICFERNQSSGFIFKFVERAQRLRKAKEYSPFTPNSELDPGISSRVYDSAVADTNTADKLLRAGELARRTGVSTDTLRHYERRGLLRPNRAANGYRLYPERAVQRVSLIRRALSLGIGLDELRTILKSREQDQPPCRRVRELAANKLSELEARLLEITAACENLRELLASWDKQLDMTASNEPAKLLEAPGAAEAAIFEKLAVVRHAQHNHLKRKKEGMI
jgi:DNA-binding transcriptional MerR regulator